jgi:hypothetical protein
MIRPMRAVRRSDYPASLPCARSSANLHQIVLANPRRAYHALTICLSRQDIPAPPDDIAGMLSKRCRRGDAPLTAHTTSSMAHFNIVHIGTALEFAIVMLLCPVFAMSQTCFCRGEIRYSPDVPCPVGAIGFMTAGD